MTSVPPATRPCSPTPSTRLPRTKAGERGGVGLVLVLLLLAVAGAALFLLRLQAGGDEDQGVWSLTPPLERTTLRLTLVEKGSLESVEPVEIINQVEGRQTILSIVPEGRIVSDDDVAKGLVLVQLDTSELEEQVRRQDIEVKSADASLENAKSNLEIQRRQNESDIRKAELAVRFARLDLERYVGSRLANELAGPDLVETPGPEGGSGPRPPVVAVDPDRDYGALLANEKLDGESRQRIRELESEIRLGEEVRRRAEDKVNHSERLAEKGFISREELDADRLALQRSQIDLERSVTARAQYATYDFPKEVQRLLSDYVEAQDELGRERDKASAAERRAEAEASAKQEQATLQGDRLAHLRRQITLCTMKATTPGMVVYASSGNERRWGDDDRIREGSTVRERQALLRIPSPDRIAATVDIHESVVRRVRKGQAASIAVDTLDGRRLVGRVTDVARMPSASDRWWNPDRKVYPTTIEIDGSHPELKPGMTASVEILTGEVEDALSVPAQAIVGPPHRPAVWIDDGHGGITRKDVTLGPATDIVVVVESGLEPEDRVVLNPPPEAPRSADAPTTGETGAAAPEGGRKPRAGGANGGAKTGEGAAGAGAAPAASGDAA
ncbi:MAG: HlyD family efflux transporter periplasmic adaptor subunit, partial [Planctomycetes bacterium]|nr:HlyD family efflux transporter periplasmic adaptor subunit [Planctomycetota bacterium]